MEKIEEYEPNHLSLLGDIYAAFPEEMDSELRSELGLENITNETITEHKRPDTMTGRAISYVANSLKKPAVALATAAVIATSATVGASDHADANDAQMVSDLDVNYTITNGDYTASLEDNRFINIVDIESGNETQITGNHYAVGSMTIDGDVLQYTTMSLQGNEDMYRLNEVDLTTGQTNILKEESSTSTPDFYTQHDTDGVNNVYVDNGSVVMNGETIYSFGNNSLPKVNGDSVAFASEQTENNETTQSVVTMANGEINTIYSGDQSVEFVDFMDGQVVYGLENLIDNKTVDLHVGDSFREVPSGMFDADNGNLTWIEQTEDGFSINLYNFETDQTENIYVSSAEMRNPQMSGDIVTWEQKYGLSDSFKSWYSDVAGLMTFESDVPVDNGTPIDNGTPVDNGTPTVPGTPTDGTDYSGLIALGAGAGLIGLLIYSNNKRKIDSQEESGGLEETTFSEEEVATLAEAVVDSQNYPAKTEVESVENENQLEEVIGDYSPVVEEEAYVENEEHQTYDLNSIEDLDNLADEINGTETEEAYVETEIPVEDEAEAEHRRAMEREEAFFGPARDEFLDKIAEDDGSVTVVNVGEGESAVINIGGVECPPPPEIPDYLKPAALATEEPVSEVSTDLELDLDSMTRDELRVIARERKIKVSGTKAELKERVNLSFDEEE